EKYAPELIDYNMSYMEKSGYMGIKYSDVQWLTIEAIQEQQGIINKQNETINKMQLENQAMKKSLCKLGAKEWC
ncbi:MAG: hypothetical protein AABX99_03505, partial [Nanoarchaeota archaeon]